MTTYPRLKVSDTFAEPVAVSLSHARENVLVRNPLIAGWWRADGLNTTTRKWEEHRWEERAERSLTLTAASGECPTIESNWASTGYPAAVFDGSNDRLTMDVGADGYPLGYNLMGDSTYIAVCSIPGVTGNITRAVCGSADAASGGVLVGFVNGATRIFCGSTGRTGTTPTTTVNAKTLIIAGLDTIDGGTGDYFVAQGAGAFEVTAMSTYANLPDDSNFVVGYSNTDFDSRFDGKLAELIRVRCSLYDSRYAALLADIRAYLSDRYTASWT